MSEIISVLTLVFVASSILILLLETGKHPVLPAYIIAGMVLTSYVPEQTMLNLSQIGIAFLVFIFGVKTDFERIKSVAEESLGSTLVQITVAGVSMYIIGRGMGFNQLNSLYVSIAAALSSSLVGLELIESEVRLNLLHGRLAESMQLIQDLIAILLLGIVTSDMTASSLAYSVFNVSALLGSALVLKKIGLGRIAELTQGSREMLMLASLSVLGLFIGFAEFLELSIAVGAFAAGMAVAKFPQNIEILDTMGSLKDFFSALFFVSLGALLTLPSQTALLLSGILFVGSLLLKPAITAISLMISGYDRRTSYLTGISLDQISEFALIIAIQAYIAGTIHPDIFQSIILAATGTMIISSYSSRYEEEIYQTLSSYDIIEVNNRKINQKSDIPDNPQDHVILVGHDTQGKEISEGLQRENQNFIVIENDPEKVSEMSKNNFNYVFGDVMDPETWKKANHDQAKLIISTVPLKPVSDQIAALNTEADKILRSREIDEAKKLLEQGAIYVNVPDILSSEELIDHINGVMENVNYREELRRQNLLDIRQYLGPEEDVEQKD